MLCKDCEHFKITAKPMMPYDSGHAHCKKYNLYVDFIDKRKFKDIPVICIFLKILYSFVKRMEKLGSKLCGAGLVCR